MVKEMEKEKHHIMMDQLIKEIGKMVNGSIY
jgi:hypothetical protein